MSLSRMLKGTLSRDIGTLLFVFLDPSGFSGLGFATISAPVYIFGILSCRMQEMKKPQNQDFGSDPAWSMIFRKMESNPGEFSEFRRLRKAASSSSFRDTATSVVTILSKSDSSLLTSLLDSRSQDLCAQFSRVSRRWSLPRWGTGERRVQTCQ